MDSDELVTRLVKVTLPRSTWQALEAELNATGRVAAKGTWHHDEENDSWGLTIET